MNNAKRLKANSFSASWLVLDCKIWRSNGSEPCDFAFGIPLGRASRDFDAASEKTMRPKKHEATREGDLFRARLDQIINTKHELVQLAGKIDWAWIDTEIAPLYSDKGRPGIESRFVVGLLLLKHMFGLSDEGVCERWVYDPYFQHFTGETFFQHTFPHERSDLSHWRKRLGDKLDLLLAESLRVAHDSGALPTRDLARVTVDTTVQPKNIAFPTDARLLRMRRSKGSTPSSPPRRAIAAILRPRRPAGGDDGGALCPRQAVQPPPPAKCASCAPGSARLIRDIRRRIASAARPSKRPSQGPLSRASQVPLAAPASTRLEALFLPRPRGRVHRQGQGPRTLRVRRKGLDRHNQCLLTWAASWCCTPPLCRATPTTATPCAPPSKTPSGLQLVAKIQRVYVDKGYRGHYAPQPRRVFISGEKRGVFGIIKRELRRRSAVEPLIGHMKEQGHLGRCYLKGRAGDAANAILTAAGYNFRRILAWLRILLRLILHALMVRQHGLTTPIPAS